MKQVTINLYEFSELSEQAKQKAIENLYDINVDYEWWDSTYYDASDIGIKITGFDIARGSYCDMEFNDDVFDICNKILSNHGEMCDTYKAAKEYLPLLTDAYKIYQDAKDNEDIPYDNYLDAQENYNDLVEEFKNEMQLCYLNILRNEYEYLTSEGAIIETIECNEYTFTEDGKLKNY